MERLSPFLLTFLLILMLVLVSLMITGKHAVKAFVPIKLFRTINTILPKCFHEAFLRVQVRRSPRLDPETGQRKIVHAQLGLTDAGI